MNNKKQLTILFVAGTRPNFMKVAPLLRECQKYPEIKTYLVHTGQHYDQSLSNVFFAELEIKQPDILLRAGDYQDYIAQKKYICDEIYNEFKEKDLSLIVVVGDVNSTVGGAMAGDNLGIPVAHVEAGLRSFDDRMPEEHNRIIVDTIAKLFFVTEPSGMKNLKEKRFNLSKKQAFLVGNTMIDTLLYSMDKIKKIDQKKTFNLTAKNYVVVTLHRKENLEDAKIARKFINMLTKISHQIKIIWPMHPRAVKDLTTHGLIEEIRSNKMIVITEPLGYFELISLVKDSLCVVTDSGGIQDETTVLNIPCLTIRRTTERPITTTVGTSTIVGENGEKLLRQFKKILQGNYKKSQIPRFWDGKTSERIVRILMKSLR